MLSLEHLAMKFTLTPIQSAACFHSFPLLLDFAYFAAGSAITKLQNTRPLWSASLTCVRRLWRLRPNTIDAILIQWHVNWVAGYSEVAPYYTQLRQSTVKVPECLWEKFWRTLAAIYAKKWTPWVWFSSGLVLQKCFWLLVLTIGLDSWLMTLCLLLLLKTQGEWKSAWPARQIFHDSANILIYRLNEHRLIFLAWNAYLESQPPKGLFRWRWGTSGRLSI